MAELYGGSTAKYIYAMAAITTTTTTTNVSKGIILRVCKEGRIHLVKVLYTSTFYSVFFHRLPWETRNDRQIFEQPLVGKFLQNKQREQDYCQRGRTFI